MFTTRQLTAAATSFTFAMAMPFATSTAFASEKATPPSHAAAGPDVELPIAPEPIQVDIAEVKQQTDEQAQEPIIVTAPNQAHLLEKPKPLSKEVKRGLDWLASQQLESGGWGQGEESKHMRGRRGANPLMDKPNVGDTCSAALALLRSGSDPGSGAYDVNIRKAVAFVCQSIEKSDAKSLSVTDVQGTRLQSKLGTNVDTFLAAQMLSEVKGAMTTEADNARVDKCLTKVINKIESHQQNNGQFGDRGWAVALNQSIASKALNRAVQKGQVVQFEALEASRIDAESRNAKPTEPGKVATFAASPDAAGIELYGAANSVGGQRETDTTYRQQIEQRRERAKELLEQTVADAPDDADGEKIVEQAKLALTQLDAAGNDIEASEAVVANVNSVIDLAMQMPDSFIAGEAADELRKFANFNDNWQENRKNLALAQQAITLRMQDQQFVAGFGSDGGEEFLSYTRIGESLYLEGGEAWETFDKQMTENLTRVQNKDGSWSGHHCITGRTFCTAAALSVLMTDRMEVPEELLDAARKAQAQQAEDAPQGEAE